MKLVLDNNIFFSLMKPFSVNSYLFSSLRAEFFAPEFIKSELKKHKEECLFKSKLSEHEFEIRKNEVEENIKFFKSLEYKDFLEISLTALTDPDDVDFLALALKLSLSIWSNDPHLKQQSKVKVYSTSELLKKLGL